MKFEVLGTTNAASAAGIAWVKVASASNPEGTWDLGNGKKKAI